MLSIVSRNVSLSFLSRTPLRLLILQRVHMRHRVRRGPARRDGNILIGSGRIVAKDLVDQFVIHAQSAALPRQLRDDRLRGRRPRGTMP